MYSQTKTKPDRNTTEKKCHEKIDVAIILNCYANKTTSIKMMVISGYQIKTAATMRKWNRKRGNEIWINKKTKENSYNGRQGKANRVIRWRITYLYLNCTQGIPTPDAWDNAATTNWDSK